MWMCVGIRNFRVVWRGAQSGKLWRGLEKTIRIYAKLFQKILFLLLDSTNKPPNNWKQRGLDDLVKNETTENLSYSTQTKYKFKI